MSERIVDFIEVKIEPAPYREDMPPRLIVRSRLNGMEANSERFFYDDDLVSQFDRMIEIAAYEVKSLLLKAGK